MFSDKRPHLEDDSLSNDQLPAGYVALIGCPNSGKSTLMNAILEVDLAITTSKPQTTRNQILGVRTYEGKGQICFVDTPGLHTSKRGLNKRMNSLAAHALDGIDAICHVVDMQRFLERDYRSKEEIVRTFEKSEKKVLQAIRSFKEHAGVSEENGTDVPINLVLNKVDRIKNKATLLPFLEALVSFQEYREIIPLSALKKDNIDSLITTLLKQLPEQGFLFEEDMLTDKAERFIAAEFVREAIIEQTHQEVPYSVAVEIERFQDSASCLEVSAVIHLERDAQKGIVIGKNGSKLKEIGRQARLRMEQFFGRKVFLETFVRVENQWSDNPAALDRFGYGESP